MFITIQTDILPPETRNTEPTAPVAHLHRRTMLIQKATLLPEQIRIEHIVNAEHMNCNTTHFQHPETHLSALNADILPFR